MRILVWLAGLWIGSLLAISAQQPPAPPAGLPIAYPFAGSTVTLPANGGGETLAAQDFGSVAAGQRSQRLLTVNYGAPQAIVAAGRGAEGSQGRRILVTAEKQCAVVCDWRCRRSRGAVHDRALSLGVLGMDKVIDGTPKSGPNLCESCAQALTVKGFTGQVRHIHCCWAGKSVHFPVYSCSRYVHGSRTDLAEMKKIAWVVESRNRGTWGFGGERKTEIIVRPPGTEEEAPVTSGF